MRVGAIVPLKEGDTEGKLQMEAFRAGLVALGWSEGRNLTFDYGWTGGDAARIAPLAAELIARKPDVILGRSTPVVAALLRNTKTVPIVFVLVADPIGDKVVESLARPGGNATGFTNVEPSVGRKWLELLKEMSPQLSQVALMRNPETAPGKGLVFLQQTEAAGRVMRVKVTPVSAHDSASIEKVIVALGRARTAGLIVEPDVTMLARQSAIISLTAKHRIPTIYPWVSAPQNGGLISYGVDYVDVHRRAATYVDRILRGARPAELPVQQPTKFELVVNTKAAKTLGITVPKTILVSADRVIE